MTLEQALELHQQGKLEEAKSIYEALLFVNDDPQIIYFIGVVELQLGNANRAIEALQHAIVKQGNVPVFHVALGKALMQTGQLVAAEESFFTATELEPSDVRFFLLGSVQLQLDDRESAQRCWMMALKCNPQHFESLFFLGTLFDEQGVKEKSLSFWQRAHQIHPEHKKLQHFLAHWYSREAKFYDGKDLKSSLEHIEKALEYQHVAQYLHQRAEILLSFGISPAAERSCLQAIHLDRKALYFYTLGNIYRSIDRAVLALEAYSKAQQMGLDNPSLLTSIGLLGKGEEVARSETELIFDQYAKHFDDHSSYLGSDIPSKLYEVLKEYFSDQHFPMVLDLGCGTGLSMAPFLEITTTRVGIDISQKMLQRAQKKEMYHSLIHRDIRDWLQNDQQSFDLVMAVDSFRYIADLSDVFTNIKRLMSSGGVLLFSLEVPSLEKPSSAYTIDHFTHSTSEIETLCEDDFRVIAVQGIDSAEGGDRSCSRMIWLLQRV